MIKKESKEKLLKIIEELGTEEILSILSEECCELAHAAQKLRRVMAGTTPVSLIKALGNLGEETGDVIVLLSCLRYMCLIDKYYVNENIERKIDRWFGRIFDEDRAD